MLNFSIGIILGFMIFFPTVVAPTIFKILDDKNSGIFLRSFFPKYYLFGIISGSFGLIISMYLRDLISVLTLILIITGFIFSRQVLMPSINQARDKINNKNLIYKVKFERLHMISVIINFLQIILCIFLLSNNFFLKLI